ncbi:MAG: translation initiation factor IF-2 [Puniceicoccales bacterium]|jgi:translation initiation factor IF-2|nr:translation initiation factor IF-2 [Puniceicoccales bacterium]
MSVRLYQLARELRMSSKEVMQLLHERGLKVTTASSSIPNIYAHALIEELHQGKQLPNIITELPQTTPINETLGTKKSIKSEKAPPIGKIIPFEKLTSIEQPVAIEETSEIAQVTVPEQTSEANESEEIVPMEQSFENKKLSNANQTIEVKRLTKSESLGDNPSSKPIQNQPLVYNVGKTLQSQVLEKTQQQIEKKPQSQVRNSQPQIGRNLELQDESKHEQVTEKSSESDPLDEVAAELQKHKNQTNSADSPTHSAPLPKKFIKIPIAQPPPKAPMVFVSDNTRVSEVSTVGVTKTQPDEKEQNEGMGVIFKNATETQSVATEANVVFEKSVTQGAVKSEAGIMSDVNISSGTNVVTDRKTESSDSRITRKKAPPIGFNEKRAAPTVHFQFTPRNQNKGELFNAIKIPGIAEGAKRTEPKALICKAPLLVRDFAQKIGLKPFQLISELMRQGIFASMNQQIVDEIAINIAAKHGFKLEIRQKADASKQNIPRVKVEVPKELLPRPPIVCVLGHVDHGKTTLLDKIRHTNVVAGEAGGITQHVDAYQVEHEGKKITFLDTPGHAAFSNMRERGANITDIAILVVAADDGFMPQTDEALKFSQKAGIPVVVAINKIDAKGANIDRVKQQMQQRGLSPEDWGGDTLCVGISALKGTNIDALLSAVLLQAEIMELKADYKCPVAGVIVESQIDVGRGVTAAVIIERGTLKMGDAIVCGSEYCRIRSMLDEQLKSVKVATPAMSVKIIGWSGMPKVGDGFEGVQDEKIAKKQAEENANAVKFHETEPTKIANVKTLFEAIASQKQKVLKIIVKCDVHGTQEALVDCLNVIKSDKVKLDILSSGIGAVSKNDIEFASSSEALVIGFNVKMDNGVAPLAKNKGVRVILHNIIYELIDRVKEEMAELLDYEYSENHLGTAEVRQVFQLARTTIAGCMIIAGQIARDKPARVCRNRKVLFEGEIDSLKRQKEDQSEVRTGFECGIKVEGFSAFEVGDTIENFEIVRHRQIL